MKRPTTYAKINKLAKHAPSGTFFGSTLPITMVNHHSDWGLGVYHHRPDFPMSRQPAEIAQLTH